MAFQDISRFPPSKEEVDATFTLFGRDGNGPMVTFRSEKPNNLARSSYFHFRDPA